MVSALNAALEKAPDTNQRVFVVLDGCPLNLMEDFPLAEFLKNRKDYRIFGHYQM